MVGRSLFGVTIASTIIMTNLSTEQIVGPNGQSLQAVMEVRACNMTATFAIVILPCVFFPRYFKFGFSTLSPFILFLLVCFSPQFLSFFFFFFYFFFFFKFLITFHFFFPSFKNLFARRLKFQL
ncbi:hypothetical protein [Staphylococcus chromogenes]